MRSLRLLHTLLPSSGPRPSRRRGRQPRFEGLEDRTLLHPKFITPLAGVAPFSGVTRSNWSIVNYVDRDSSAGARDYKGGGYTYDGHRGIDMTLPNFAAMDKGVKVLAAADGTILSIRDHVKSDRHWMRGPFPENVVAIDHGDGWVTYYRHLRYNSVPDKLQVGQPVHAGDVLGLAGSSGSSTMAHLHFEVQHDGMIVDTFQNPTEFWVKPLPYAGDTPGISDAGLSDHGPTWAEWRERPKVRTTYTGLNAPVYFWMYPHGIKATYTLQCRWSHDGTPYTLHTLNHGAIHYGYLFDTINAFPVVVNKQYVAANWKAEFLLNGKVVDTQTFVVNPGMMRRGDAIQFDAAAYSASEADSQVTVKVTRTGSSLNLESKSTVQYLIAAGTAREGTDFVTLSGTLTFQPKETTKTITIPLISHLQDGLPETVELHLLKPGGLDYLGANGKAILTIRPVPGQVQFRTFSNDVNEGAGTALVWVNRLNGGAPITVDYQVQAGTATLGKDFGPFFKESLSFGPGDVSKPIEIPIIDDGLVEADETVLITLSNPSAGASLGAPTTVLLTIHDNDPPPSLKVDDLTITEGDSGTKNGVFIASLSAPSGQEVRVHYARPTARPRPGLITRRSRRHSSSTPG